MSNKLYAVQFRSMRTAIHNISIFGDKEMAQDFCMFVEENQELPEEYEFNYDSQNFMDTFEIDYRKPPTDMQDIPLEYLNSDNVPDAYNY